MRLLTRAFVVWFNGLGVKALHADRDHLWGGRKGYVMML